MSFPRAIVAAVAFGLCGPAACNSGPPSSYLEALGCTSGATRDPNESEGPEMTPGRACITCHAEDNAASGEGDAPIFAFAGTVFPGGHEPDDCIASGSQGAQVIVTDAMGKEFTAAVNAVGNFLFEDEHFAYPYQAKVVFLGRERRMQTAQQSGDCNRCHTAAGDFGAPGRIVLP